MTSAIEEHLSHLVAWEIVNRPETNPDEVVFLRVFTHRDGESVTLNLEWEIDKSLCIAFYEMEAFLLFARDSVIGRTKRGEHLHLTIEDVARKSQSVNTKHMIDIPIDFVLVYTFGYELRDDVEYLRTRGIEGEPACVGHHATIYIDSHIPGHTLIAPKLPYQAEYHLCRTAHSGIGE
jgi:hypothetical protein